MNTAKPRQSPLALEVSTAEATAFSLGDLPAQVYRRIRLPEIAGQGCWEWLGAKSRGYGTLRWQGRPQKAHRVVYEILVGPIPDGLTLDHLCRNPACVCPEHLEPVTQSENSKRSARHRFAWTPERARAALDRLDAARKAEA